MTKEERLKEVLEYRISRAQNEPIDDMDWFIENTIKDVLEAVNTLPSNLDEAAIDKEAKEYAFNNSEDSQEYKSGYLGFIAGAKLVAGQGRQQATATGRVFTNTDPKILIADSDQWAALLDQFDNGQRVRIILVKEDEK